MSIPKYLLLAVCLMLLVFASCQRRMGQRPRSIPCGCSIRPVDPGSGYRYVLQPGAFEGTCRDARVGAAAGQTAA